MLHGDATWVSFPVSMTSPLFGTGNGRGRLEAAGNVPNRAEKVKTKRDTGWKRGGDIPWTIEGRPKPSSQCLHVANPNCGLDPTLDAWLVGVHAHLLVWVLSGSLLIIGGRLVDFWWLELESWTPCLGRRENDRNTREKARRNRDFLEYLMRKGIAFNFPGWSLWGSGIWWIKQKEKEKKLLKQKESSSATHSALGRENGSKRD